MALYYRHRVGVTRQYGRQRQAQFLTYHVKNDQCPSRSGTRYADLSGNCPTMRSWQRAFKQATFSQWNPVNVRAPRSGSAAGDRIRPDCEPHALPDHFCPSKPENAPSSGCRAQAEAAFNAERPASRTHPARWTWCNHALWRATPGRIERCPRQLPR